MPRKTEQSAPRMEALGFDQKRERSMGCVVTVAHADFPHLLFSVTFSGSGVPVGFAVEPRAAYTGLADMYERMKGRAPVPEGPPLTAKMLRRLPLGAIQDFARHSLTEWGDPVSRRVMRSDEWAGAFATARRPGRAGRSDHAYAAVAAMYVDMGHDVHKVAKKLDYSASQVRNILYEARRPERGLLTKSEPGKAGGQLTAKARRLLTSATEADANVSTTKEGDDHGHHQAP